jgi:hypothetical protein
MATRKKKTKKKQTKSKKATPKRKEAKKKPTSRKTAKTKFAAKKSTKKASKKKASAKKKAPARKAATKPVRGKRQSVGTMEFSREGLRPRSGGQSGDLQGLSNIEGAASESVDELLEEGNAFEADAVKGVEDAGGEGEVHTHEVPEDDVPGEYLDKE